MGKPRGQLKLEGFNHLTKSLSFNIYDISYAVSETQRQRYIEYIDEEYDADRLTEILLQVVEIIGGTVLDVARQDYDPQGASVTILMSDRPALPEHNASNDKPKRTVAHLDKSHITVHTYPEMHPHNGIATFRVDIDVATCGLISPLEALDYLIKQFDSDVVIMDYRVRGFTRNARGKKLFIDHKINSIQESIHKRLLDRYECRDVNVYQENLFHTKMHLKNFNLDDYLFSEMAQQLSFRDRMRIEHLLRKEIIELYQGYPEA
ncbi:S-adenosylmethionine decarboxylase [Lysobacter concretionis Ko07 = DSM 16239]|jgi:S-adenosylmethionine decarboxylase|uniref:S-adenosylmethionine decarboxylase proenzyme n=1 Tax=Lysobacter concretionis Ko07 = DSM 16239 TaxID=1122185 RepID=A0A0A0EPC8_9GAMM|nr:MULTISPECIES: adenosylmethionine decarboxylase [Lysobacter]KGM52105.1 S-adenosylmethionine decarboxylase [Lysobacter concretionis Ko07 = DSM 16239]QOD90155.1 adenosylmethionine decarboxylase [Lysobacter sp. CW239]